MNGKTEELRKLSRIFWRELFVLALSVLTGFALLLAAFSLPTERIWKHVSDSANMLIQETSYFSITPGVGGSLLDNVTEALYLNEALVGKEDGLIRAALSGFTYASTKLESGGTVKHLQASALDKDHTVKRPSQVRFWNGYEVFLKPFLEFTDYAHIRQIHLLAQSLMTLFLLALMEKRGLLQYRLPLCITYLFMNPVTLGMCMTFAGFTYCIFIPCIVMSLFHERLRVGRRYWIFFEIIGICAIYFNMNYFQLLSFGIPLTFYYLLGEWPQTWKALFRTATPLFLSWLFGFAAMMAAKWALYAVFVDSSVFGIVWEDILFRTSGSNLVSSTLVRLGIPDGLLKNLLMRMLSVAKNCLEILKNPAFLLVEFAFIWHCASRILPRNVRFAAYAAEFRLTALATFLTLARYLILANHTNIHYWATYRLFAAPLFCFNVMLASMASGGNGHAEVS